MAKYVMTKSATFVGTSGIRYTVKKGQTLVSVPGELPDKYASEVSEERMEVVVEGEKAETAAKKPKAEKRSK